MESSHWDFLLGWFFLPAFVTFSSLTSFPFSLHPFFSISFVSHLFSLITLFNSDDDDTNGNEFINGKNSLAFDGAHKRAKKDGIDEDGNWVENERKKVTRGICYFCWSVFMTTTTWEAVLITHNLILISEFTLQAWSISADKKCCATL